MFKNGILLFFLGFRELICFEKFVVFMEWGKDVVDLYICIKGMVGCELLRVCFV